jgi:hypothetical protein
MIVAMATYMLYLKPGELTIRKRVTKIESLTKTAAVEYARILK